MADNSRLATRQVSRRRLVCLYELFCVVHFFSALTLLVGRQEGHPACKKTEWWGAGVVICLELGADLHIAQLMPLPLTVSRFSKIVFWHRLTQVVPDKGPLNVCVCVCVWFTSFFVVSVLERNALLAVWQEGHLGH